METGRRGDWSGKIKHAVKVRGYRGAKGAEGFDPTKGPGPWGRVISSPSGVWAKPQPPTVFVVNFTLNAAFSDDVWE